MSFFKASKDKEDLKQGGNSAYINGSGMYPVTILAAIASASSGGSTSVDFYVDHEGQKQVVYGNVRLTNNDGSPNAIGSKIFNQLVIIAGLDSVADPVEYELPIGKKEAMKTVSVLEDLNDIPVLMRVQLEYTKYKGNIQEKKIIKAFFRDDMASAEEIVNESEVGVQYEKEMKYVDNITYKDDLTAEDIKAWIDGGRQEGTAGSSGGTAKPARPTFGNRRAGQ